MTISVDAEVILKHEADRDYYGGLLRTSNMATSTAIRPGAVDSTGWAVGMTLTSGSSRSGEGDVHCGMLKLKLP